MYISFLDILICLPTRTDGISPLSISLYAVFVHILKTSATSITVMADGYSLSSLRFLYFTITTHLTTYKSLSDLIAAPVI